MTGLLATALLGAQAQSEEREGTAQDAWIDGTLETVFARNRHLNAFEIKTEVDGGIVHLTGDVSYEVDRDLAGKLAKNIEGVIEVDNDLVVTPDARRTLEDVPPQDVNRTYGTWIDDATTTAGVESRRIRHIPVVI